jgi:hypothetical protein
MCWYSPMHDDADVFGGQVEGDAHHARLGKFDQLAGHDALQPGNQGNAVANLDTSPTSIWLGRACN